MNKQNSEQFNSLMEAADLLPPEPRRQILEVLAEVENQSDEIIANTIEAIRTVLGEDFGIITA